MIVIRDINLSAGVTDKVNEHLEELERFNGVLVKLKGYSLEDFLADKDIEAHAERSLHGALEAAMSIGEELITVSGGKLPVTYEAVFNMLGDREIIATDLAKRLRRLEDFHNILIHGQIENWEDVYDQLGRADDFQEFVREIRDYLSKRA